MTRRTPYTLPRPHYLSGSSSVRRLAGDAPAGGAEQGSLLGQNGSMPRSNRPRRSSAGRPPSGKAGGKHGSGPVPELDLERARAGVARRESAPDGDWIVRSMTARKAE